MKSDLDKLMQERGFDAIVIMGHAEGNHTLKYMTNGVKVTEAIVLKKRDQQPVLICGPMERDEAAKSGLTIATYADFDLYKLSQELGSSFDAYLHMLVAIFERYQVAGTITFNGLGDPGRSYMMLSRLAEMLPAITITGETETNIFDDAYATKDAAELEAIRVVAAHANTVMGEVVDFIKEHQVQDDTLVKSDGEPLTVGDTKRFLRVRLLEYGLEDGDETIFAIGRDAGIPHSRGEEGDPLKLGQSIIFDLFPRALGGGYFHDMAMRERSVPDDDTPIDPSPEIGTRLKERAPTSTRDTARMRGLRAGGTRVMGHGILSWSRNEGTLRWPSQPGSAEPVTLHPLLLRSPPTRQLA